MLTGVDLVHIVDPVAPGDGMRAHPIVTTDAIQRLPVLDGMIVDARAFARMRRFWRMWVLCPGDPQCLTGIDVVAIAEPVCVADGVWIDVIHPADGEQGFPVAHSVPEARTWGGCG